MDFLHQGGNLTSPDLAAHLMAAGHSFGPSALAAAGMGLMLGQQQACYSLEPAQHAAMAAGPVLARGNSSGQLQPVGAAFQGPLPVRGRGRAAFLTPSSCC